jgi:hypothetical protein
METQQKLTEAEQQKRLHLAELVLPHFGISVVKLLDAATAVEVHDAGLARSQPCSTDHKG